MRKADAAVGHKPIGAEGKFVAILLGLFLLWLGLRTEPEEGR